MASKRDREKTVRQEESAAPVPAWHGKAYGALIAAGGLMLLLSLATFRLNEVGWTALNAKAEVVAANTNFFGFFGRYLARCLIGVSALRPGWRRLVSSGSVAIRSCIMVKSASGCGLRSDVRCCSLV